MKIQALLSVKILFTDKKKKEEHIIVNQNLRIIKLNKIEALETIQTCNTPENLYKFKHPKRIGSK